MRPVVLVHGFGSSFEHGWREPGWADILADGGREVIGVDLLGHGESSKPLDPAAYRDGLRASVADVLPAGPVDAVGFSLGADQLLRLAVDEPDRFARLAVIGVGDNLFSVEDAEPVARALEGEGDDAVDRVLVKLGVAARNDPAALAACLRRPRTPLTSEQLTRVGCPVLVVLGERDDLVGSARILLDGLPDARLVTVPRVDHFQTPRSFECIDAVVRFLEAGD